jgi:large-conductance mechanosensitive channel
MLWVYEVVNLAVNLIAGTALTEEVSYLVSTVPVVGSFSRPFLS